jgi:hypothetical protein
MHTLLDLLLIATLVALALSVTVALLVRRAVRRLRGTVRARIAAARANSALPVLSRPIGGPAPLWSPPPLHPGADRLSAVTGGVFLSARAWLPGPGRAVSVVRRDLHRDVVATSRVLRAAGEAGRPVHELDSSVAMLAGHARELQLDLHVIAAEPDRELRARMLAEHTARASDIRRTCASVRAAVLSAGSTYAGPALRQIVDDINDAVSAIDLRARAYQELSRL